MMAQGCVIAFTPGCKYPAVIAKVYVVYILSLFLLFAQFFLRKYMSKSGDKKGDKKGEKGKGQDNGKSKDV